MWVDLLRNISASKIGIILSVIIIGLAMYAILQSNLDSQKIDQISNNTRELLETSKQDLQINKASLENQHNNFISDLRYEAKSIHLNQFENTFSIRNDGKYDTFVRNTIWLTAICDFDGNPDSIDKKISEDEIIIRKNGDRGSTSFILPPEVLNENVKTFGMRLISESFPYTSGGHLENKGDHKKTSLQFVYNDDRTVWQPSVVIFDGGFSCMREPYGGDIHGFKTLDEEDFQECNTCYD
jgi:hypothetical protein